MDAWFTEEGATGELEIAQRDGSWFVVSPPGDANIKCIIDDENLVDESPSKQRIRVTVSKFRQGMDGRTSFLSLTAPTDERTKTSHGESGREHTSANQQRSSYEGRSSSNETWELKDFRGSGEYVNVEATIDAVFYVKKDVRGIPDIKGKLTDESVLRPVTFIVEDDVNHPYLGEGERFLFKNVKDHLYKKENEVQVVINDNTRFTEV